MSYFVLTSLLFTVLQINYFCWGRERAVFSAINFSLLAHLSRRLTRRAYSIAMLRRPSSVCQPFSKIFSSETA